MSLFHTGSEQEIFPNDYNKMSNDRIQFGVNVDSVDQSGNQIIKLYQIHPLWRRQREISHKSLQTWRCSTNLSYLCPLRRCRVANQAIQQSQKGMFWRQHVPAIWIQESRLYLFVSFSMASAIPQTVIRPIIWPAHTYGCNNILLLRRAYSRCTMSVLRGSAILSIY